MLKSQPVYKWIMCKSIFWSNTVISDTLKLCWEIEVHKYIHTNCLNNNKVAIGWSLKQTKVNNNISFYRKSVWISCSCTHALNYQALTLLQCLIIQMSIKCKSFLSESPRTISCFRQMIWQYI